MNLTSDQKEALEGLLLKGDWATITSEVALLMQQRSAAEAHVNAERRILETKLSILVWARATLLEILGSTIQDRIADIRRELDVTDHAADQVPTGRTTKGGGQMNQAERNKLGKVLRECYDLQKKCPVFTWDFWAELLAAVEQMLTEGQGAAVEQCLESIRVVCMPPPMQRPGWAHFEELDKAFRVLSPDPYWLKRRVLEAELDALIWATGAALSRGDNEMIQNRIAEIRSQLAALPKEKP